MSVNTRDGIQHLCIGFFGEVGLKIVENLVNTNSS